MTVNLLRYALVYIATTALIAGISFAMEAYLGISLPSGVSGVIPIMSAAMVEGLKLGEATDQAMDSETAWSEAIKMTGVVIVISFLVLVAFAIFVPKFIELLGAIPVIAWIIIFAILIGIALLVNRFMLTQMMKSAQKQRHR